MQEVPSNLKPVKQPPHVAEPAEQAALLAFVHVVLAAASHLSTQESPLGLKPVKQSPQVVVPAEQAALFKLVHSF